ncbi:hypothetical protein ACN4EK_21555 [Pantanalinema rosaneae CENA516]|uniref:hypothetical protein n=1 Tax=Pantanalinema rosaneae TaxID=1620701 RepID=UPI003D6FE166
MQVQDLSHFEMLHNSSGIYGSSHVGSSPLTISLDLGGSLVISHGDEQIYSTTLTGIPTGIILALDGISSVITSTTTQYLHGSAQTILAIGLGGGQIGTSVSATTSTIISSL